MERNSGRPMAWARGPRTPKPDISYVSAMGRGVDCAVKVSTLTRGGPWMWTHDNYDRDDLSKLGRGSEASRGVGRTHSSRKTLGRRHAWRHAKRTKPNESAVQDCGGEGGNTQEGRHPNSCREARHGKGQQWSTRSKKEEASYAPSENFERNANEPTLPNQK